MPLQLFSYERRQWSGVRLKEYDSLSAPLLPPPPLPSSLFVRAWRRSSTCFSLGTPISLASLVTSSSETDKIRRWSSVRSSFKGIFLMFAWFQSCTAEGKLDRGQLDDSRMMQNQTTNINYVVTHECMWKQIWKEACRETKGNVISCCTAAQAGLKVPINTSNTVAPTTQEPAHSCHEPISTCQLCRWTAIENQGAVVLQVSFQRIHSHVHM